MEVTVSFVFLITIAPIVSNSFAIPVNDTNKVTVEVHPQTDWPSNRNVETLPKIIIRCPIVCDITGNQPICGTDGKDYTSPNELICYQMCGHDIQVQYYGKCGNPVSSTTEIIEKKDAGNSKTK